MMKLDKEAVEKIYQHALREYPEECCGIVTGSADTQTVYPCRNIQNRLHAEDAERFPRDARTAYMIDRSELDRVTASAEENGHSVLAFYHSHPGHEAFFSEEDVAAQTVFGEPEFPDAVHVVVSVINSRINDMKCYKWDGGAGRFRLVENCA